MNKERDREWGNIVFTVNRVSEAQSSYAVMAVL